jgi:hydrogenase maturation protease
MDPVAQIAQAVLYEGYVLWPYRRSALKNRQRWTFGGVHPAGWTRAGHDDDPSAMQTQCLVLGAGDATADVVVRFLHVVDRRVARLDAGGLQEVDELTVAGERHLSWEEATEREVTPGPLGLAELERRPRRTVVDVPEGESVEPLGGEGAIVRRWEPLAGAVEIGAEAAGDRVRRLTVRIENTTPWPGGDRHAALRRTMVSTHVVVRAATGAELVSLEDPPDGLRDAAQACVNVGTWPVLVGEEGERHTILSAPIILGDYPRVAPESPGDLFDGGEIDELLILNVLGLTDAERREARESDPRARELIDRCAGLSEDQLLRLHGTIRELRPERRR